MSHHTHRKEKNCLNCGAIVQGPFCQQCGQENIEPKETAWQLIVHFFNDITHFDGKFFTTLKILLFRPGYLPREYMLGRRASYLNPVRMYIFTSFIFFLIFFSLNNLTGEDFSEAELMRGAENKEMISKKEYRVLSDSIITGKEFDHLKFTAYMDSIRNVHDTSGKILTSNLDLNLTDGDFRTRAEYDSLLKSGAIKDGWLSRKINYKAIDIREKYKNNEQAFFTDFLNVLQHNFPQMFFISLPFMALVLKLFYRRQKQFYYVSHAIFMVHFYIFVFIMMLLSMGIVQLQNVSNLGKISVLNVFITLYIFIYLYKSMRNFYGQRRMKTILKYFLFLFSMLFVIIFLIVVFAIFSIFQV